MDCSFEMNKERKDTGGSNYIVTAGMSVSVWQSDNQLLAKH